VFTIIATNACGNTATAWVTNTWTVDTAKPVLSGVPMGTNFGCNPTNVPTVASIQSEISASDTCSPATVHVSEANSTNGCGVIQVFTITATNACGNAAIAYVTNTWAALPTELVTNISYLTNIVIVTNTSFTTNKTITTNTTYVTNITVTTNCCTNTICGNFNSQNPGSGWLWCNAHISGAPGSNCTVNCQNASVTLSCTDGKNYTFPIPNGTVNFSSSCTVASNWFDGTSWHTMLPCGGDSEIFLQGCAIPWQSDFANCQSVCWTGAFSCSTPGFSCNWQWGAACYSGSTPGCGSIAPKACLQTPCPNGQYYKSGDQCGTPENCKPYCVAGGTGGGGANCTGSWSGTSTTCTFGITTNKTITTNISYMTNTIVLTNTTTTPVTTVTTNTTITTTIEGPVLSGVPAGQNFGCNSANVPTVASVEAEVSASETCSAATVVVTESITTNGCEATQIFTISASNACGSSTTAYVTNTWNAGTGPSVECPTNVVITTNNCKLLCTFSPSDWNSACIGYNTSGCNNNSWNWNWKSGWNNYGNNWWTTWCQNNPPANCWPSWTNWWTSCNGTCPSSSSWWANCNPGSGNHWSGSCTAQSGNWWNNWANNNTCSNEYWVPCSGNNPGDILTNCFASVYTNGCVKIGLPGSGYCLTFTSPTAVRNCLNVGGNPGVFNCSATNPITCNAGSFCSQVLALQLNCDFGDCTNGAPSFFGRCGDAVLTDPTSPCNGQTVRQILACCNTALGCGSLPQGCTISNLCGLCCNVNQCFEGCQVSSWCTTHLAPVYIPPPSQTGTATVTDTCSSSTSLTYCDSVATNSPGNYIITRTWTAVDACGHSNSCSQTITVQQGGSFSGTYEIQCEASGLAVNVYGGSTSDNAQIIQWPFNGSANSLWTFVPTSNGYYQITGVQSGLDLVVSQASTSDGAGIIQYSFGSSGDDQWKPVQNSDGSYTLYNLHSGLVLDDPGATTSQGAQFDQWSSNGTAAQKYKLIQQ
jgi:hypothetical protein